MGRAAQALTTGFYQHVEICSVQVCDDMSLNRFAPTCANQFGAIARRNASSRNRLYEFGGGKSVVGSASMNKNHEYIFLKSEDFAKFYFNFCSNIHVPP